MEGPVQFRFLNYLHSLPDTGGWEEKRLEKLWLYNLHYFDDLNAENFRDRIEWHRNLINRWIAENEPGKGTGWEPYPTSLRIVNWIKWALAGNSLDTEWLHSLAIQTRWLQSRLEWHLMGNHLFANAKALVFAGVFFEGSEANGWLKTGLRILDKEITEQVLEDGGHFELSPMYHSIILEDVIDLLNVSLTWPGKFPDPIVQIWRDTAEKMLVWLSVTTHPDGKISFFNDATFGIASSFRSLRDYATRLDMDITNCKLGSVRHLASSGYVRITMGDASALLDVARIGPDYMPGHGHADTLSFEFTIKDQRIFVNSGTSLYEPGLKRLRQRGTRSHNTVEIDGKNSSEVWGSFRVAKRAKPMGFKKWHKDNCIMVQCSHDGYERLPGRPIHHREWKLGANCFEIKDVIYGSFKRAVSRFYVHPDVQLVDGNKLVLPSGTELLYSIEGGVVSFERSKWYPEFGVEMFSNCMKIEFQSETVKVNFYWN
tara:strand:+ start:2012 stop:3466 length:1455 start_codon:yes stop_codon:yes gene_type:complete